MGKKIGYFLISIGFINFLLTLGLVEDGLIISRNILLISIPIVIIGSFLISDIPNKKNYIKNKYKYFKKKCKKNYRWEGWKKESKNLIDSVYAFINNFSEWLDNQWVEFKKTLLDDLGDIILMFIISAICLFFINKTPSIRIPMIIVILFVSIFAVSHCLKKLFDWGVINVINVFLLMMILISLLCVVNNYLIKLLICIFTLWITLLFCKKGLEEAGILPIDNILKWFKTIKTIFKKR